MWGGELLCPEPEHAIEEGSGLPMQMVDAMFRGADLFCLPGQGRPVAAGHEAQTRTVGFHGYVASPVGCADPFARPALSAVRSGVVEFFYTRSN